ncbi:MAG: hypothetical protein ACR2FG_06685 [Marmoricola sp.]
MDAERLVLSGDQVTELLRQVLTETVARWGIELVGVDLTLGPGQDR